MSAIICNGSYAHHWISPDCFWAVWINCYCLPIFTNCIVHYDIKSRIKFHCAWSTRLTSGGLHCFFHFFQRYPYPRYVCSTDQDYTCFLSYKRCVFVFLQIGFSLLWNFQNNCQFEIQAMQCKYLFELKHIQITGGLSRQIASGYCFR